MKKFLIMLCLAATVMSAAAQEKFPMITIPEDVTDPLLRAKYLSDHFWENVDFETASDDLISNGLSELIPILRIVDYDAMTASWAAAVKQAEESKTGVAHLLKVLGAEDALNLDGGGSTALWLRGAPQGGVLNYPCDNRVFDHRGERTVPNFLYVYSE